MDARAWIALVRVLVAVAAVSTAAIAEAQVPLIDGLGGAAGYGSDCLGPNDDGSSMAIDLTPVFPTGIRFFDRTHTRMYVNTNGNVSFSAGVATYTPEAFPVADQPMIAPYWADVDIRSRMCSEPAGGSGYAGACASPTDNGVWWHLDTTGRRVIVTWDNVGYYSCHTNSVMAFQLVLTPADTTGCGATGGDFDVEFRYNRCEWNTGDASGGMNGFPQTAMCMFGFCPIDPFATCVGGSCTAGTPAQAGFDAGNSRDFVEIMGSRTATIHTTLCTMSNVGAPGIWRFQIRSGVVICPGAGDVCDTGMLGVCGAGRTQCVGDGTECRPEVMASAERCDALDNDCDGMVDDGDGLCAMLEVCDRGTCVAGCFEGGCPEGQVCTAAGRCVDAGCEGVTCDEGERCVSGVCAGACDGVTCPAGRDCRAGRCVDLCAGATCDDCTVCEDGACVARCQFEACASGETCLDDGRCVETACATVTCPPGQVCTGGSCADACSGAVCPSGERCELGECVPAPVEDGGVAPPPDGGVMPGVDAGLPPGTDAGPDGGGGFVIDGGRGRGGASDPGCACRAAGARSGERSPFAWAALALIAIAFARVRRRR